MTGKQMDRLLDIIDRAVKIAERWADREYPIADENADFTISRHGKPLDTSTGEISGVEVEEEVGRFEKRFRAQA